MYSVAPTIVLPPISQRLWKAGPQSTMLKASPQPSTTVHKTVSPQRATLGDPEKNPTFNKFIAKKYKKCNQKGCHSNTERLSKLQPVSTGTASVNNIGSHNIYCIVY